MWLKITAWPNLRQGLFRWSPDAAAGSIITASKPLGRFSPTLGGREDIFDLGGGLCRGPFLICSSDDFFKNLMLSFPTLSLKYPEGGSLSRQRGRRRGFGSSGDELLLAPINRLLRKGRESYLMRLTISVVFFFVVTVGHGRATAVLSSFAGAGKSIMLIVRGPRGEDDGTIIFRKAKNRVFGVLLFFFNCSKKLAPFGTETWWTVFFGAFSVSFYSCLQHHSSFAFGDTKKRMFVLWLFF